MKVPIPGLPQNPPFLLGDSDIIVQALLTGIIPKLNILHRCYGLHLVIVEAVEAELPALIKNRFPDRVASYNKALKHRTITPLSQRLLSEVYGDKGVHAYEAIEALGDKISNQGVGRGEAYTHAAGILLRVPVISNDMEAIRMLRGASVGIPDRILRFFDLVVFFFQIQHLTTAECKTIRQELLRRGEHMPGCFKNCSFENGLPQFFPRLLDGDSPRIGAELPFDQRLDQTTLLFKRLPESAV